MSEILSDPIIDFSDEISLREALINPTWMETGLDKYRVKSQLLCDLLDRREKSDGYQYNLEFQRWFEKEYNVGSFNENNSPLSVLIYNAQRYRRSDALKRDGFIRLTQDLIDKATQLKMRIEIRGENILGGNAHCVYKTKTINAINYLMVPRSRTKCIRPNGQPARLI